MMMSEADAFNSGDTVVDTLDCKDLEEVDRYLERILELWPYAGYRVGLYPWWDIIKSKEFDRELYHKLCYGVEVDEEKT